MVYLDEMTPLIIKDQTATHERLAKSMGECR